MRPVFVHPTADVSTQARIGSGSMVWNNAQIREDVSIGEECVVGKDVYIDKGVSVGDRVKIQNSALLYQPLRIGNGVFIGPRVTFTNDRVPRAVTPTGEVTGEGDWPRALTSVAEGASIGAGAIVLPGIGIGAWAMVGAGSLVTRDVAAHQLVAGSPARPVRWICRCGDSLKGAPVATCETCARTYRVEAGSCTETVSA